ncbi:MAG: GH92 family glycosyl hydrolase [Bacteroidetes bacterium]|nr:GH92 family glycosyl hydrolase [Bacteroidota bacterium]
MANKRILLLSVLLLSAAASFSQKSESVSGYVNPFIGTGGHGHTFPGASMPFGMVQLSPDTRLDGWDGCSAYYGSDTVIYGFSHTHLSGTGCSDYGDILVMPFTGEVSLANYGYRSGIHQTTGDESAKPGYYKVFLDSYKIQAELTATNRTGVHQYTFPAAKTAGIVIDLKHRDKVLESSLKVVSPNEVEGSRISEGWARRQILYFVARFSKPFSSCKINSSDGILYMGKTITGDSLISAFYFSTEKDEKVLVKVGISAVSTEGARSNLDAENPGWDFGKITQDASSAWDSELGKVTVEGGTGDQKINFYTALYHTFLSPNLYMDVDGSYRGRDLKVHTGKGFDYYTVFSLWDTYRAAHPLYILTQPKRDNDFIRTFLAQFDEGGILPVWELSANETDCMIGYHSVPVIVDAYMKGVRDFDAAKALEAMKHSAEQDRLGLKYFKSMGFIPGDKEGESVSKTLEYSYDDWCIAKFAQALGNHEDYKTYIRRAQFYKNLFDPSTGFMRAKMNNTWHSPFDPAEVNFNYTEANAWQYSFYVPQDLDGLIRLHGGKEKFARKLDAMFTADSKTTGRNQSDITGLIGQYAHGNEPSHHMAYLYDYAGEPWKTQELVHRICTDFYTNKRDGLCGNEDCGQMSAWYVMSAMGFYPVTPGSTVYAIGTPMFPKLTIHLENGKTFTVRAEGLSDKNFYITGAKLNGVPFNKCYIEHKEIISGGELTFTMGSSSNKEWGSHPGDFPVSAITDNLITPVPFIDNARKNFTDTTTIRLGNPLPGAKVYYTLDGSDPSKKSTEYAAPVRINHSVTLKAFSVSYGLPESQTITATFQKIPKNRKIKLNTGYSPQYTAGGDLALIDFEKGSENFRTGSWQGYEGVDLDVLVDLGESQVIHTITAGFLQDEGSWIFFPLTVSFSISEDGKTFKDAGTLKCYVPETQENSITRDFSIKLPENTHARYVHVVGKNRGVCPSWHPGAGSKAWIFADEISVE